jgi:hypothetical protein
MMGGGYAPRVGGIYFYNDLWRFSYDGILALHNLSFNAKRIQSNALLSWESTDESGISGYHIQRKYDGLQQYETIGFAVARQSPGQPSIYSYTDLNISSAEAYYRLQVMHSNGEISYSDIRLVPGTGTHEIITVYPNPSAGQLVNILFSETAIRNISLVSVNGGILKRWNNYASNHMQLINIPAGIYMLKVENKETGGLKTRKIVIMK